MARLEHVNITVPCPEKTAEILKQLFGWIIRWQGEGKNGGLTIHIGTKDQYIALYAPGKPANDPALSYHTQGYLNHIGVVVDDLDKVEGLVKELGFQPMSHDDYEPGRRFYFYDSDSVEYEIVSYS